MKLIITEKPSVAMEFCSALGVKNRKDGYMEGNGYYITWCVGHLITMSYPEKYNEKLKNWNMETLPFLPEKYIYEVIPEVKGQFKTVKMLLNSKDINTIYYAGDPAREGIYIQYLVRQEAGHNINAAEKVVWIDSQTEEEILNGIRNARDISEYRLLADSGYMRAIEDYSIGINFSRALSVKYGDILNRASGSSKKKSVISVGRVMICVLGMIVSREREIREFKESVFYKIRGTFSGSGKTFEADWQVNENSEFNNPLKLYDDMGFKEKENALELAKRVSSAKTAAVTESYHKTEKKNPPLLFNLAELQAECTKLFKISPDETLKIIQGLYEKKLVTYPRTDARVLSTAIANVIDVNIKGLGSLPQYTEYVNYILANRTYSDICKTRYVDDSKISDHYAIIPTGKTNEIPGDSTVESKVYDLIVRRFISLFYPPAEYSKSALLIGVGNETFYVSNKTLKSPGYLEITGSKESQAKEDISVFNKGDTLNIQGAGIKEGHTSPPKRYTSGSMILAMENAGKLIEDDSLREMIKSSGIGTSATRAEIIKKLDSIGYISINNSTQIIKPEKYGEMIYETVNLIIPEMLVPKYTAQWEKGLEEIASGKKTKSEYNEELNLYITDIVSKIKKENVTEDIIERIKPFSSVPVTASLLNNTKPAAAEKVAGICPECGKNLVLKKGKFSMFISCSGYPKCRYKPAKK